MKITFSDFLTIVAIIVAIVIPIFIYLLQNRKNRKSLVYDFLYNDEVLSYHLNNINDSIGAISRNEIISVNSLEVKINSEKVSNLWLVGILVLNNGSKYIDKSEYEENIRIHVPKGTKIISADATMINSAQASIGLSLDKETITVQPMFLNPSEIFAIKMILTNDMEDVISNYMSKEITVTGRIRGVKKIKRGIVFGRNLLAYQLILFFFFIAGMGITVLTEAWSDENQVIGYLDNVISNKIGSFLPLFFMLIMVYWGIVMFVMQKKERRLRINIDEAINGSRN